MSLAAQWTQQVLGYVLHGPIAYRIRRVRSADLQRVGLAALEGSETYSAIRAELEQEAEEAIYVSGRPAEEQPAARAALAAKRRKTELRHLAKLDRDPVARKALLDRAAAYVCAAIDGAGQLVDPASVPDDLVLTLQEPAVSEWYPWRWVPDGEAEDEDAGIVSIGWVPEGTVYVWGQLIQSLLQGVTRRGVGSFRVRPGASAAAAPAGDDVRDGPGGDRAG